MDIFRNKNLNAFITTINHLKLESSNKTKLAKFFQQEYKGLRSYVNSRISNAAEMDAEDIIQDVALRLFSRPLEAVPISNVPAFVYTSVRHRIIDVMRGKRTMVRDDPRLEGSDDGVELEISEDRSKYAGKLKNELDRALSELKPMYRDLLIAIDMEGYTYAELEEITGIPKGTLMSRRHRALTALAKKIDIKKWKYGL